MPSKSEKQHRLMEAVKHNPKFAKKVGIPQSVGEDFVAADKRTGRYATGGGVLGSLAGRAMRPRPIPDMRIPDVLRHSDGVITGARNRLGTLMKRAKGGKVAQAAEAVKKVWLHAIGDTNDKDSLVRFVHDYLINDHKIPQKELDQIKYVKHEVVDPEEGEHAVQFSGPKSVIDSISKKVSDEG